MERGLALGGLRDAKTGGPVKGVNGLLKAQWDAGQNLAGKAADAANKALPGKGLLASTAKTATKVGLRALPIVGSIIAAGMAVRDFKDGDYVGGVLNSIGVIPGPIGWVGMGAALLWDGFGSGETHFGKWDTPDGTTTHMLPAAAKDVAGVSQADMALTSAQRAVFGFQDGPQGTVWNSSPPEALRIDTPAVESALNAWLKGIADHFAQIEAALQSSGEPYFQEYRQKLAPHFAAMAKLPELTPRIKEQLTASSEGAAEAYKAVLSANVALRTQLADQGELSDQGPATAATSDLSGAQSTIAAANDNLVNLVDAPAPLLAPAARGALQRSETKKDTAPDVKAAPTSALAPAPAAPANGADSKNDLDKFLSGLKNPGLGGAPMGSPMGSPIGGGSPLGGTPLASPQPAAAKSEPTKLVDDAKKPPVRDEKKAELSTPKPENKTGPAAPLAAATAAQPEAQPGAAKPAAAKAAPPDTTVDVRGEKVKFPDAKTAKLASLLAASDPTHPVSLTDAAKQSGLVPPVPGQDPGQQVAPSDARPGDVLVTADQRFLVLGEGRFLDFDNGKVIDADMVPKEMGDRGGYFRLHDPAIGGADGAGGPVSGQTPEAVQFAVPNSDATPDKPTDGSPGAASDAPQSVPVTGTPGVPKQSGEGPANDVATDTGIGESVPSAKVQALDPTAVK